MIIFQIGSFSSFLIQGDENTLSEIYHRHKEALYFHANRSLKNHDETPDTVQQVFTLL